MPTIITHTVVAGAAGILYGKKKRPREFWLASIVCSSLPDADVLAFAFGVPYHSLWGHRGIWH